MRPTGERILTEEQAEAWAVIRDRDGYKSCPSIGSFVAHVRGAFNVEFEQTQAVHCGGAVGMSVNFGRTQYGYSGGVLDRTDVRRLRDFLTEWLDRSLVQIDEEGQA